MKYGALCPYCGYNKSMVVDSRPVADGVRRRRECDQCGKRFTTYEFTDKMVQRIKNRAVEIGLREGMEKKE